MKTREMEFRGKLTTDDDKWRYGYYSKLFNGDCFINNILVIPETVGQYTGQIDKKGVKIFEGDILKVQTSRNSSPTVYEYRKVNYNATYFSGFVFDKGIYNPEYHEVVGNIYDTPEMLEG